MVVTPQQYKAFLEKVFNKNEQGRFEVKDILVVPDYKALLDAHINNIEGWTKGTHTQLAFKFEKCKRNQFFPCGVCKFRFKCVVLGCCN